MKPSGDRDPQGPVDPRLPRPAAGPAAGVDLRHQRVLIKVDVVRNDFAIAAPVAEQRQRVRQRGRWRHRRRFPPERLSPLRDGIVERQERGKEAQCVGGELVRGEPAVVVGICPVEPRPNRIAGSGPERLAERADEQFPAPATSSPVTLAAVVIAALPAALWRAGSSGRATGNAGAINRAGVKRIRGSSADQRCSTAALLRPCCRDAGRKRLPKKKRPGAWPGRCRCPLSRISRCAAASRTGGRVAGWTASIPASSRPRPRDCPAPWGRRAATRSG